MSLIKCDEYGNYLAVKDIDTGPVLRLKIPKNHEYFKLLLRVSADNSITSTITTLNIPLVQNEKSIKYISWFRIKVNIKK
jgi:cellulose synthase (UDP-forming)